MATDIERLVVSLEASITKYEKAMSKAVGDTQKTTRKIEKEFSGLDTKLGGMFKGALGGLGTGLLAGAAGFLSVEAAIQGTIGALDDLGHVADMSAKSALDPEFFQALAYQASLGGVALDDLAGAMATFAKNSALAEVGKGKMVTTLKELNPVLLENIRNAATQEARLKLVADALAKETDAARRAAIATAAFGEAGSSLANIFAGGADEIEAMQVKAKDLGIIIDRDLIANADALGDEFDTVTKILDVQVKQALINLGPFLVWLAGLAANLAGAVNSIGEGMKPVPEQSAATLERQLEALKAAHELAKQSGMPTDIFGVEAAKIAELEAELRKRAMDSLRTQLTAPPPVSQDLPSLDELENRDRLAAAAENEAQKVRDLIAELEYEHELIGMTAQEKEVANALRRAGAAATDEQRKKIEELAAANFTETLQVKALQDAYAELWNIGEAALNSLVDAMADGTVTGNELLSVLGDIAKQLGQMFIKNAFSSMSGGGGFDFASLFAGRAAGGPVSAGTPYMVGENGPELFMPRMAGTILPASSSSSGAGNTTIHIDARGAQIGVAEQITRALDNFERFRMPGKVRQISRDPHAVGN